MDDQSIGAIFAYMCVTALSVLLSRTGLKNRIEKLEAENAVMLSTMDSDRIDLSARMRQQRSEFRAEVDISLQPIRKKLEDQDAVLGQIKTMVSSLVNRGDDGQSRQ